MTLLAALRQARDLHEGTHLVVNAAVPRLHRAHVRVAAAVAWFAWDDPVISVVDLDPSAPPLRPSLTLWRRIEKNGAPVLVDLLAEPAQGFRSRSALIGRHVTHIAGLPLRLPGRLGGMLSFELRASPEDGDVERRVGPALAELEEMVDGTAATLALLPVAEREVQQADEVPVLGSAMRKVLGRLGSYASMDEPILLRGESGTGKTKLAEWVHRRSGRKGRYITLPNMRQDAADLFGWKRGAFTGADRDHPGPLSDATGGTIFVDEIDKVPLDAQRWLLRLLDDGTYNRLGDSVPRTADVRFLFGSNADLQAAVTRGAFLHDLYFRIQGVSVVLPPLRERRDEIPCWVAEFVRGTERPVRFTDAAVDLIAGAPWPGNLRQLRQFVRATVARVQGRMQGPVIVDVDDVRGDLPRPEGLAAILRGAAKAFVAEARRGELRLEDATAFRALVLCMAVEDLGVRPAFETLGMKNTVDQGNAQRLHREAERTVARLLENLAP